MKTQAVQLPWGTRDIYPHKAECPKYGEGRLGMQDLSLAVHRDTLPGRAGEEGTC